MADDASIKEGFRAEILAVYAAYSRLLKENGSGDEEQAQHDYQRLLDAGQGSCAAARLAASLAPRFLHRFPHQLDAAASLLMRLATCKARSRHDDESVIDSTRADALRGLGNVLDLSGKVAGQAVPTVLRVVEFLLRQLHAQMTSDKSQGASPSASLDFCNDAIDNLLIVQQLLEKAFRAFPRVVLAACLQSFGGTDPTLYRAALAYLEKHLLFEHTPPPDRSGAAGKAAGLSGPGTGGGSGAEAGPGPSSASHAGRTPGGGMPGAGAGAAGSWQQQSPLQQQQQASQQQQQLRCLASEVLRPLPDTQAWLLQALIFISKDQKLLRTKELRPILDKLLRLVTLKLRYDPDNPSGSAPPPPPTQGASAGTAPPPGGMGGVGQSTPRVKVEVKPEPQVADGLIGAQQGAAADAAAAGSRGAAPGAIAAGATGATSSGRDAMMEVDVQGGHPWPGQGRVSPAPGTPGLPPGFTHPAAAAAAGIGGPHHPRAGVPGSGPGLGPTSPLPVGPGFAGFTGRGGPITRAAPCLFMSCLPPALTEAALRAECSKACPAEVVLVASCSAGAALGLGPGEAYVVFKSTVPDAALIYEAMADTLPFGGSRPLHIEFCGSLPPGCQPRDAPGAQAPFVWVGGHSLDKVLEVLRQAGLPNSERVFEVAGRAPGLMMDYSRNEGVVQAVVDCLALKLLPPQPEPPKPQTDAAWPGQGHWMSGHPAAAATAMGRGDAWASPGMHAPPGAYMTPRPALGHHLQGTPGHTQQPGLLPGGMPGQQQGGMTGHPQGGMPGHHQGGPPGLPQGGMPGHAQGGIPGFQQGGMAPGHTHTHGGPPGHPQGMPQGHPQAGHLQGGMPGQPQGGIPGHPQGGHPQGGHPQGVPPGHLQGGPGGPGGPPPGYMAHGMARPAYQQGPGGYAHAHPHLQHQQAGMGGGPPPGPGPGPGGAPGHLHMRPGMSGAPHLQQQPAPGYPYFHGQRPGAVGPGMGPGAGPFSHAPPAQQQPGTPGMHPASSTPPPHLTPGAGHSPQPMLVDGTAGGLGPGARQVPDPAASASAGLQWQGSLSKSGAPVCSLLCTGASGASPAAVHRPSDKGGGGGGAPEPLGWPASLDVKLRAEVRYAEQLYLGTAPPLRALRWLVPQAGGAGDPSKLPDFLQYLAGKSRAGVIKLAAHGSAPARVLYLIPPSDQVCAALGAEWPPPAHVAHNGHALLAVIVPSHDAQRPGGR